MINGFIKSVHKTLITGIRIHCFCGKSICNLRNRRSFRFLYAYNNNMKTNQRFIAKSYSFYESSFLLGANEIQICDISKYKSIFLQL